MNWGVWFLPLLMLMLLGGLWAVMTANLLNSAIALALTSIILTILLFLLEAPLAGVFELSICASLITVVLISAISLSRPLPAPGIRARDVSHLLRFWPLPLLLAAAGWALFSWHLAPDAPAPPTAIPREVHDVLWNDRRLDLVGQILMILAGVFGVGLLFKEPRAPGPDPKQEPLP